MAERIGIRAVTINSTNRGRVGDRRGQRCATDECDVLLVSPERLANERFLEPGAARRRRAGSGCSWWTRRTASPTGATTSAPTTGASCASSGAAADVPVLATTATANDRVVADVAEQLGPGLAVQRGPLARAIAAPAGHHAWPTRPSAWPGWPSNLPELPGSGIVYCLTVADCRARGRAGCSAQGIDGRGLPCRRLDGERAGSARGAALLRQPGQGAGGDGGPRHGLRQARPGLRHPLPAAGLGRRLLPAGGPRRARRRPGLRRSCSAGARTTRSRTTSSTAPFPGPGRWNRLSRPSRTPRTG